MHRRAALIELEQVEAAERGRELVLPPARDAEVLALDRVRELGDLARRHRALREHRERTDARGDQRGGTSEAAARRRVGRDVDVDPRGHAHPLDRGLGQVHHAVVLGAAFEAVLDQVAEIQRPDPHLTVLPRREGDVRGVIDRGRQDGAAVALVVVGEVGAASDEADPKGRARADRLGRHGSASMGRVPAARPAARSARRAFASGHEPDDAAALLLGQATPHAVALPVLQRPREAGLPDVAGRAEREGGSRLLLGGGEERVRVDPVAGRLVLPDVRGGWVGGRAFRSIPAMRSLVTLNPLRPRRVAQATRRGPVRAGHGCTVRVRTRTVLKSQGPRSNGGPPIGVPRRSRGMPPSAESSLSLASQRIRTIPARPARGSTLVTRPHVRPVRTDRRAGPERGLGPHPEHHPRRVPEVPHPCNRLLAEVAALGPIDHRLHVEPGLGGQRIPVQVDREAGQTVADPPRLQGLRADRDRPGVRASQPAGPRGGRAGAPGAGPRGRPARARPPTTGRTARAGRRSRPAARGPAGAGTPRRRGPAGRTRRPGSCRWGRAGTSAAPRPRPAGRSRR